MPLSAATPAQSCVRVCTHHACHIRWTLSRCSGYRLMPSGPLGNGHQCSKPSVAARSSVSPHRHRLRIPRLGPFV
jgi:hypothetical protein